MPFGMGPYGWLMMPYIIPWLYYPYYGHYMSWMYPYYSYYWYPYHYPWW